MWAWELWLLAAVPPRGQMWTSEKRCHCHVAGKMRTSPEEWPLASWVRWERWFWLQICRFSVWWNHASKSLYNYLDIIWIGFAKKHVFFNGCCHFKVQLPWSYLAFKGMIDYERAVAKRKRQLFRNLFDLLPKSGPVVSCHLLPQDFLCIFLWRFFDSLVYDRWTFQATCVWNCGIFFWWCKPLPKNKTTLFFVHHFPHSHIIHPTKKTLCHYGFKAADAKGWMSEVAQEFSFCFNNFSYWFFMCRSWRLALEAFRTRYTWVLKMHHRIWTSSE